MEHLKQETTSGAQLNMDALYQICPQCFTESKDPKTGEIKHAVDFEKLRLLLGDNVAEGDERYDFTWVGKRAALQEAAKPIRKTLRPCPEESVDWENTKNLYIEGDNLEVLKLLQNSYMGKVKMIYIDPPYNTGNDFVYQDDFHQTKKEYDLFAGDVNEEGVRLVKNTESNGRFHSDWCSMIYARLMVARNLLTEDGAIFISIGDDEEANLIKVCDEVFGEKNFVSSICHKHRASVSNDRIISENHNHLVFYAKNFDALFAKKHLIGEDPVLEGFNLHDERGDYKLTPVDGPGGAKKGNPHYEFLGVDGYWRYSKETMQKKYDEGIIVRTANGLQQKYYKDKAKESRRTVTTWWDEDFLTSSATKQLVDLMGGKTFDNPKNVNLVLRAIKMLTKFDDNAVVLDFFSGSGTTAHALMQMNLEDGGERKFILVQLNEEIAETNDAYLQGYRYIPEIAKERIRRAGKKIIEEQKAGQGDLFAGEQKIIDVGFRVFKCADSNMKDVYYSPVDYSQQMLFDLEDNIKEDRNDLDLLFGCMLDWGVTLDLPLRTEKVDGVNIHVVNEGDLVACFEKHIPESVIDHIASLLPMRVVLRDSCFDEAKEKMNFFEIFKQRTGWSEEEVRKNVKVI